MNSNAARLRYEALSCLHCHNLNNLHLCDANIADANAAFVTLALELILSPRLQQKIMILGYWNEWWYDWILFKIYFWVSWIYERKITHIWIMTFKFFIFHWCRDSSSHDGYWRGVKCTFWKECLPCWDICTSKNCESKLADPWSSVSQVDIFVATVFFVSFPSALFINQFAKLWNKCSTWKRVLFTISDAANALASVIFGALLVAGIERIKKCDAQRT